MSKGKKTIEKAIKSLNLDKNKYKFTAIKDIDKNKINNFYFKNDLKETSTEK